jgi:hypothetical protein
VHVMRTHLSSSISCSSSFSSPSLPFLLQSPVNDWYATEQVFAVGLDLAAVGGGQTAAGGSVKVAHTPPAPQDAATAAGALPAGSVLQTIAMPSPGAMTPAGSVLLLRLAMVNCKQVR